MKTKFLGFAVLIFLLLISCETDPIEESSLNKKSGKSLSKKLIDIKLEPRIIPDSKTLIREIEFDLNAIDPTAFCEGTELGEAFRSAWFDIWNDPNGALSPFPYPPGPNRPPTWPWIWMLLDINFVHSMIDDGPQYFGNKGQYTQYVNNRVRNLEKFWNMPNEVSVRGQHNETMNDRDAMISALSSIWYANNGWSPEIIELITDIIIGNNANSEVLPESTIVASDGFAWDLNGYLGYDDLEIIVIGDGLVKLVASVGTEDKIGWTTILSHEWAHHVQFNNGYLDDYDDEFGANTPESTRAGELEADFIASYYMTHKRGATYNWKRIEQYLVNFFQIGDCSFTNPGHHGTPLQRMEASKLGNELANSAQKKGKILSADEVHDAFIAVLDDIAPQP